MPAANKALPSSVALCHLRIFSCGAARFNESDGAGGDSVTGLKPSSGTNDKRMVAIERL